MRVEKENAFFIGCACDHKFVEHTAVMLTSLTTNGQVPEATVLVAGFGLDEDDRKVLRAGAGGPGAKIEFIDISETMLSTVNAMSFSLDYPLPVIGRLFLPEAITVPGARLLTVDSDMIVNRSIRPLFEMNMQDQFLGATHDVPRIEDLNYFNSGLLLIDVDGFKAHDIARRSLRWLADQSSHPGFPDQDALNCVVGDRWVRVDRSWNWFYTGPDRGDKPLATGHYEAANIAHFAGGKPWNYHYHPGRPLYERHLATLKQRKAALKAHEDHVDVNFVETAHDVLLGHGLPEDASLLPWLGCSAGEVVRRIIGSREFRDDMLAALLLGQETLPADRPLSRRERAWVASRLPIRTATARQLDEAGTRRDLLQLLLEDDLFTKRTGLRPFLNFASGLLARREQIAAPPVIEADISAIVPATAETDLPGQLSVVSAEPAAVPALAAPGSKTQHALASERQLDAAE